MPRINALPPNTDGPALDDLLPMHNDSNNTTEYIEFAQLMALAYPVGSVYTNAAVSTNPATLLGFGTWTAFATGRVLVGVDAGQSEFNTLGETGGAKTHTLVTGEIPSHSHGTQTGQVISRGVNGSGANDTQAAGSRSISDASTTATAGGGGAHNNLQPYITVYMWQRTA